MLLLIWVTVGLSRNWIVNLLYLFRILRNFAFWKQQSLKIRCFKNIQNILTIAIYFNITMSLPLKWTALFPIFILFKYINNLVFIFKNIFVPKSKIWYILQKRKINSCFLISNSLFYWIILIFVDYLTKQSRKMSSFWLI